MTEKTLRSRGFRGRIGFAGFDITPPVGIRMRNWGAQRHEVSEGNETPLRGTVFTFQSDPESPPLILAGLDLGWWRAKEDEWFVRRPLVDLAGDARVVVNLAHIHSGPSITREDGGLVPEFLETVRDRLLEATKRALSEAKERDLGFARAHHYRAANRDLPVEDRYVVAMNPDAEAYDTMVVGMVKTPSSGCAEAVLACVALHPTTVGWESRRVSSDYVAAMRDFLEAEGRPLLFLQGASGDLASPLDYCEDRRWAANLGYEIAHHVDLALYRCSAERYRFAGVVESGAPLGVWRREAAEFPRSASATLLSLRMSMKPLPAIDPCADSAAGERIDRQRMVRRWVGEGEAFDLPVWVWKLGDASLVATPTEAYSILQRALSRRFPERMVVVTNVSNGWIGYLPPQEMYEHDVYSVNQTPFAAGGLERLIEACAGEIAKHG